MKAAILAAGIGSRLRPLTNDLPKCLTKVYGKSILQYQLEAFKNSSIEEVFIVTGYESEKLENYCRSFKDISIKIICNTDYENNNNMFSLYLLKDYLVGEPFMFCNADVIYDENIVLDMSKLEDGNYIAVDVGNFQEEAMKVELEGEYLGSISKMLSKAKSYGSSLDLYRLDSMGSKILFAEITDIIETKGDVRQWTEVALDKLMRKKAINFLPHNVGEKPWVEIDSFEDLEAADIVFCSELNKVYKNYFLDIDGTLFLGSEKIQGADLFLKRLREKNKKIFVISNNSSKNKHDYVKKFAQSNMEIFEEEIILSTDGVIHYLKENKIRRAYCLGTQSLKQELEKNGIRHTKQNPEIVVLGYDTELTYKKLEEACFWINKGREYVATHPDMVCPTPQGSVPDVGTFINVLQSTTQKSPIQIFGKPNLKMLEHLFLNLSRKDSVLIGDRIYTDKLLANRAHIDFICVLSGETKRQDLQRFSQEEWPNLVVPSVKNLVEY